MILDKHTHTTVLRPFVWDYPGEPVPKEIFSSPNFSHRRLDVYHGVALVRI